ncbi:MULTISPECIES: FAD-dependent oxidoreductase [Pelosinus]|jgi:NADPH-dependent 2,4-dienoyl-CoA reductase/sulfur reductase-like enzyme/rhodanese-related sulfurtransferase|uniref:Pyridine nucleotide-disulfide oxidoreductase, FAD/NAD(P)-binding domain-containing protein n=1 Tax=Pelosinus fermentans B4 TaxID=1149862 RepID=I8RBN0_9FIRM|nr:MULTISPECIES: FAD-dependent oxidoreductase [Pelosinus]MDF2569388.1 CoA-disulfide reductase [Sporomusa sp.]EIW16438.1 Pyridine nucleotide-disulfide oxidoreductase, FAD/NAD(P)-binding domain-containing protein [Pelosinus fermentans B4]EIW22581.1 FAD-dependent pyridine nucleotide-disulfide oxidoreductase [Pelosinus fermentans A11]OAM95745.1 CoA-disulfide reductase [Pelosinus fermentans DSM 17108]SDR32307.1 NADPH-dependent 2,4-dienoyl-CoA reductase, sulfur reductase [Pelosinus fermentans]
MKKIVIIGGVAAGLKAAAKARRCDPKASIIVLERGELISYGACGMPYYVSGDVKDIDDLMKTPVGAMRNSTFFKNVKDITVLTKTEATAIDREAKTVKVQKRVSGEEEVIPYDKLVIATGASAIKPPLAGVELSNIYQLWHPDDAKAVRQGLEGNQFKSAVIIGAGLIGMEMAEALTKWKIPVTVVEMKNQVFPAFLDTEIGGIVGKYVQDKGITLLLDEKVVRFTGDTSVAAVETDKRSIPADLVILAIGARPNVELAKAAGLVIGSTGAIVVDEEMRTSDPDIYAGGDCVENVNVMSGKKVFAPMGSTANKHGRIIGENLCGGHLKFKGVLTTAVAQIHSLSVGKTGLTERDTKQLGYDYITTMVAGHDKPHYMPGAKLITVKLIVDANTSKVLGMQAVGEGDVSKRIDVVATVLTLGGSIEDLFDIDLSYAPPYNSPIDNVVVAANTLMNKLAGKFKGISSLEAKEKMTSGDTVFLDVRSPEECKQIRLADYENITYIPLGQLRSRLVELNKNDEIIAFCKISLRGYEAEGILEGVGFENVKVLEGGIVSWPFVCDKKNDC